MSVVRVFRRGVLLLVAAAMAACTTGSATDPADSRPPTSSTSTASVSSSSVSSSSTSLSSDGASSDGLTSTGGASEVVAAPTVAAAAVTDAPDATEGAVATASSSTTTLPPIPVVELSPQMQAQIDHLIATTESIRQLEFLEPPTITALTPEGIVERRRRSIAEDLDPDELAVDSALYDLFGVFDGREDLVSFYSEFFSASTLAFYDLDDHELVIPVTGELLTPYEQWILVHELTHALMDQVHRPTADRYVELVEDEAGDETGALLGLIEGEAVLVQSLFFDSLSSSDRADLRAQASARSNPTFAAAPAFFRNMLRFPYTDGSHFTLYLYRRGGMAAIDAAHALPPTSTEQIYDPDRYVEAEAGEPVDLSPRGVDGFEEVERGVWGARAWRTLFGQFVNGGIAAEAANGWGGDAYRVYWEPETLQLVFVALFVGDSTRDAAEFGGAIDAFVEAAVDVTTRNAVGQSIEWHGADYAFVERSGDRVVFVAATNRVAGRQLLDGLPGFGP